MKIGLLDHMGYGNLGDAATQEALITNIKKRLPDAEIVGFSLNPDDTKSRHGITSYSITYWHPGLQGIEEPATAIPSLWLRIKVVLKNVPVVSPMVRRILHLMREVKHLGRSFKVLRSLDSLIIAGGGQLGELWRGPWSHPYNVFKFSLLAKLANRKLLIINVGAGPLSSWLGRVFVKSSVYLADYVSLRDVESQALIQRLGVKRKTHIFPDSVYALDIANNQTVSSTRSAKPLVGINPIGFCDPRTWLKKDEAAYLHYLEKLAAFSSWLLSHNYRLTIFSGEASVDRYALEDLKELLINDLSPRDLGAIFLQPSENVDDLLAEMSRMDFIVTSKFHGVVFSHLLAKPVIALSYHNKINDLMRTVGHDQHCLDIESFDCERLKVAFMSMVEDAPSLKVQFNQATQSNAEILKAQFDELFVPDTLQLYPRTLETNNRAIFDRSA
jgi:polysaccharide pyruvyl transferase WcaK-like protein